MNRLFYLNYKRPKLVDILKYLHRHRTSASVMQSKLSCKLLFPTKSANKVQLKPLNMSFEKSVPLNYAHMMHVFSDHEIFIFFSQSLMIFPPL